VLLHLAVGEKESTVCWKSFFEDMKRRGLKEPLLVVIDGNSGLRKAGRIRRRAVVQSVGRERRRPLSASRFVTR